jgi:hypothetical protein
VKKALANPEPSTHGTFEMLRCPQFGRHWRERAREKSEAASRNHLPNSLVDVIVVFVQPAWALELLKAVSMPLAVYRQGAW